MSDPALIAELRAMREELAALRAELAPRRRAARTAAATMTSLEAARFLGMDRKTFYRRGIPALLTPAPVGRGWTRRSVEAMRARLEGTAV